VPVSDYKLIELGKVVLNHIDHAHTYGHKSHKRVGQRERMIGFDDRISPRRRGSADLELLERHLGEQQLLNQLTKSVRTNSGSRRKLRASR